MLALWAISTLESRRVVERVIPGTSIRQDEHGVVWIAVEALRAPAGQSPGTDGVSMRWLVEFRADSTRTPHASRLAVLRDGAPLGAGHLPHAALRDGVVGWSHWSGGAGDAGTLLIQPGRRSAGDVEFASEVDRYKVVLRSQPRRWLDVAALGAVVALVVLARARRQGVIPWTRDALARHRLWLGAIVAVVVAAAALPTLVDASAEDPARWLIAGGLALLGVPIRASSLSPALRRPLRIVSVMVAAYAATAVINAPNEVLLHTSSWLPGASVWWIERAIPAAALLCGAIAWFRPSLIVVLAAMASWRRIAAVELTGFPNVSADWLPVAGFALVVGTWIATLGVVRLASAVSGRTPAQAVLDGAGMRVLLVAGSLQLGHYVASAIEKLRIGSDLFDWVTGNRTEFLLLAAESVGAWSPLAALGATERVVDATAAGRVPINAVTLAIELLPLVAVFRLRWMVVSLLMLAGLHLGIWTVTGIGFWKWMILDVALAIGIAATWRIAPDSKNSTKSAPVGRGVAWKRGCALAILMLLQPSIMEVVRLGWHDTPALNRVRFDAVLDDGTIVPIPATFFASGSYRVACAIYPAPGPSHFPTETWATTDDVAIRDAAVERAITLEGRSEGALHGELDASDFATRAEAIGIADILRRHHSWALARCDPDGRQHGSFWPHHIVGRAIHDPGAAADREDVRFEAIDLRRIAGYRVVAESLWLRDPVRNWPESVIRRDVLLVPVAAPVAQTGRP